MTSQFEEDDFLFHCKTKRSQMLFEFWFLVSCFIIGTISLILIVNDGFEFKSSIRISAISALGGFFGGWVFVTKWFYRVTARGKDNQKKWQWEPHKIYWRIFTPFISSIVSVALFSITVSNIFPLVTLNKDSCFATFGFSFLMGYFSDIILSKLFDWTTLMWGGKGSNGEGKYL